MPGTAMSSCRVSARTCCCRNCAVGAATRPAAGFPQMVPTTVPRFAPARLRPHSRRPALASTSASRRAGGRRFERDSFRGGIPHDGHARAKRKSVAMAEVCIGRTFVNNTITELSAKNESEGRMGGDRSNEWDIGLRAPAGTMPLGDTLDSPGNRSCRGVSAATWGPNSAMRRRTLRHPTWTLALSLQFPDSRVRRAAR